VVFPSPGFGSLLVVIQCVKLGFSRGLCSTAPFFGPRPPPLDPCPKPPRLAARGSRSTIHRARSRRPARRTGMTYTPIQLDGSRTTDRELDGSRITTWTNGSRLSVFRFSIDAAISRANGCASIGFPFFDRRAPAARAADTRKHGSRLADHIQREMIEAPRSAARVPDLEIEGQDHLDPGSIPELAGSSRSDPGKIGYRPRSRRHRGASRKRTESPGGAKKRAAPVARGGSKDRRLQTAHRGIVS